MWPRGIRVVLVGLAMLSGVAARGQERARIEALLAASQELPLEAVELPVPLLAGQELGKVSWIAVDAKRGVTWLIQRGEKAEPVIAVDKKGTVLHSFGRGRYAIPHAIRLDPEGNVWTVDAGSSRVIKYSTTGEKLLEIEVGEMPKRANGFAGATDLAFAPGGRIFISDGYGNARVLEYSADGKKRREWGSAGTGAGQFHLPHAIVIDENNVMYVADRENERIEKFDLEGKFLGEIDGLGRTYSLKLGDGGVLWAGMAPKDEPTGAPGWVVKLDRATGKIMGYVRVNGEGGLHSVEVDGEGNPMTVVGASIVVFKPRGRSGSVSP